jgi:hypothetical protein
MLFVLVVGLNFRMLLAFLLHVEESRNGTAVLLQSLVYLGTVLLSSCA